MLITVKEIALMFDVSENEVYRWIKQKEIPCHKINEQYRFNQTEIMEWAATHHKKTSALFSAENKNDEEILPLLIDAVKEGGIFYNVKGNSQAEVLKSIVELLNIPEDVDRDFLYQILLAREELGSTAVGNGIAIPHVRNPIVLQIDNPIVMLCFLEHPIDFKALDEKPVNTLFVMISKTVRGHLRLLSRIASILHDQTITTALSNHEPPEILLNLLQKAEESIQ